MAAVAQIETRQQAIGLGVHALPVNAAETVDELAAEEDVFRNRQLRDQVQLLMDNADARFLRVLRPVERHLFTEKILAAGVFLVDAGQHFHHGGLTGAVFSHQRHHLAGIDAEGSAGKRLHAGKGFINPFQLQ